MSPQRIQRRRSKGFDLQAASPNGLSVICVSRPSRWGNPFAHDDPAVAVRAFELLYGAEKCVWVSCSGAFISHREQLPCDVLVKEYGDDGEVFIAAITLCQIPRDTWHFQRRAAQELHGKNLACWCPLDAPCHADVLLRWANHGGVV